MASNMPNPKILFPFLLARRRGTSISISQYEEVIDLTEDLSLYFGVMVIFGLFIEVFVTIGYLENCKFLQKTVSIISSIFVAVGVSLEIYFGNLSGKLEKELRHIITKESEKEKQKTK